MINDFSWEIPYHHHHHAIYGEKTLDSSISFGLILLSESIHQCIQFSDIYLSCITVSAPNFDFTDQEI